MRTLEAIPAVGYALIAVGLALLVISLGGLAWLAFRRPREDPPARVVEQTRIMPPVDRDRGWRR